MVTAQQVQLEATAALLERAYRLALVLETAPPGDAERDTHNEAAWIARELLSVLDDARAALLSACAPTPPGPSATLPSA